MSRQDGSQKCMARKDLGVRAEEGEERGNMCNWAGSEMWVGGQADCQTKAKGREWIGRGGV